MTDDRTYSVTTINGYRQANLTREQARAHAAKLADQMQRAGWRGKVCIWYRDGSCVDTLSVG